MHELFQSLNELPPNILPFLVAGGAFALLIFLGGALLRAQLWLQGREDASGPLYPLTAGRILWFSITRFFAPDCFFARRVFANSRVRGIMVSAIVWSFVLLLFGVAVSAITFVTDFELEGPLANWLTLVMDLAGGFLRIGLTMALARRFIFRPARYIPSTGDTVIILVFFITVLSGLVLESTHLAEQIARGSQNNPLAMLPPYLPTLHQAEPEWYWQPFGALIARIGLTLGFDADAIEETRLPLYLAHAAFAFLLIAYLPFSKLFHLFAAQITTYARSQQPRRAAYPLAPRLGKKL